MFHSKIKAEPQSERHEQLAAMAQNVRDGFMPWGTGLYEHADWQSAADSVLTDILEGRTPDYDEMDWMDQREAAFDRFNHSAAREGCFEEWLDRNGLERLSRSFGVAA